MKRSIVFLFCFLAGMPAFGENKTYLYLVINEVKTEKGLKFSLKEAKAVFGNYDNFIVHSEEAWRSRQWNYVLAIFDSKHESIGNYIITSSRFIFKDEEKNGRTAEGLIEIEKEEMHVVVPFDRDVPPSYFVVRESTNEKRKVRNCISLPVEKLLEQFDALKKGAEKRSFKKQNPS